MGAEGIQVPIGAIVIRILTAAVLVVAAVPFTAGAKPDYTAMCNTNTHDLTATWPGGTDVTETRATLEWADGSDETLSLALPKQGGLHTYTWTNVGSQSGPLAGVVVQFVRNSGFLPSPARASCSP
jgi:hypothetical protein